MENKTYWIFAAYTDADDMTPLDNAGKDLAAANAAAFKVWGHHNAASTCPQYSRVVVVGAGDTPPEPLKLFDVDTMDCFDSDYIAAARAYRVYALPDRVTTSLLAGAAWGAEAQPNGAWGPLAATYTDVKIYAPDTLACDDVLLAHVLPALFGERAAKARVVALDDGTNPRAAQATWSRLRAYLEGYDFAYDNCLDAYHLRGRKIALRGLVAGNSMIGADSALAIYDEKGYVDEFAWFVDEDRLVRRGDDEEVDEMELLPRSARELLDCDVVPAPVVRALREYVESYGERIDPPYAARLYESEQLRLAN